MNGPGEPVIATRGTAALADVLILGSDGRASADRCTDLFARYPGLTLVMITTGTDTVDIGLRDGSVRTVRAGGPVEALAGHLYAWWCRRQLRQPPAQTGGPRRPLGLQDRQGLP
jgi:hypothetical protein